MASVGDGLLYADSSALVKLLVREPETAGLTRELARWSDLATSVLSLTEVPRAVARARLDGRDGVADDRAVSTLLGRTLRIPIDDDLLTRAGGLEPVELRSLDAIHIVSASLIGDGLAGVLTYDERMQGAARRRGLPVLAPG